MADTLIQGGFENFFSDGVEIGNGAVIDAPEVLGGFGASMLAVPLVTTTGGSGDKFRRLRRQLPRRRIHL